ncbi:unnamed protein product, partial [Discosporangium mesarthrocarpum]
QARRSNHTRGYPGVCSSAGRPRSLAEGGQVMALAVIAFIQHLHPPGGGQCVLLPLGPPGLPKTAPRPKGSPAGGRSAAPGWKNQGEGEGEGCWGRQWREGESEGQAITWGRWHCLPRDQSGLRASCHGRHPRPSTRLSGRHPQGAAAGGGHQASKRGR